MPRNAKRDPAPPATKPARKLPACRSISYPIEMARPGVRGARPYDVEQCSLRRNAGVVQRPIGSSAASGSVERQQQAPVLLSFARSIRGRRERGRCCCATAPWVDPPILGCTAGVRPAFLDGYDSSRPSWSRMPIARDEASWRAKERVQEREQARCFQSASIRPLFRGINRRSPQEPDPAPRAGITGRWRESNVAQTI